MLLEGIFAAITTPFYSDERIYYRKLEANIARYSRSLLAGMVVLGSTGEAPLVDDAEARGILRVAADAAAREKVLIAGVGRESVKATVELAEAGAEFRYDAILVRPPSYFANQLSSAAILHYYRSIADRSPLPVIIYNIPQCVPYQFPIELVGELAGHPNIIGIKDSSGKVERIGALVAATANAPRRTVPVTQVFEAVTARMIEQPADPEPIIRFSRGVGRRSGCRCASSGDQNTQQGSRLSGSLRIRQHRPGITRSRSDGRDSGMRRLCAAGLPGDLPCLEGPRLGACTGEAEPNPEPEPAASSQNWASPG